MILSGVNSCYLAVPISHQPCSEDAASLDFKYPLDFDTSSIVWHIRSIHLLSNLKGRHILEFLHDSLMLLVTLDWILIVPILLVVVWLYVINGIQVLIVIFYLFLFNYQV